MNQREQVQNRIGNLTEEQLCRLMLFLDRMESEQKANEAPKKRKKASEVMGILHEYANPELMRTEDGAWERDIVERINNGDESF